MFLRYFSQFDSQPMLAQVKGRRIRVGSDQENDIVLKSPFVDRHAIELRQHESAWVIQVLGRNGCQISGQRLHAGDTATWDLNEHLEIYPFRFQAGEDQTAGGPRQRPLAEQVYQLVRKVHLDLIEQIHLNNWDDESPDTPDKLLLIERSIESSAARHGVTAAASKETASELAAACTHDAILDWILEQHDDPQQSALLEQAYWSEFATLVPTHEQSLNRWKLKLVRQLFGSDAKEDVATRVERMESRFWTFWDATKEQLGTQLCQYLALRQLKKQVKDSLFGFGPLEDLLRLPTVTEIMVNASDEIFIEKCGVIQNSGRRFVSDEVTQTVIERIVGKVGRRIDVSQPMVDARLADGSRVNAVIPPLAVKGPCITIRKFSREAFTLDKLRENKSFTAQAQTFLTACVQAKRSILISGGTGTGKTTLLNCLSQQIPHPERIICIEDTHEIQLDHPHVVFVECRDGNTEGKGKIAIRDLLRNSLRQRPDRLIVGECRGNEALDMLQAMNTGHDGSMTTIHANTPPDALRRLEVLVRESGLPPDAVRQQIVSAVDVVVQLKRLPCGKRIISAIHEVVGYDESAGRIRLRPLFHLRQTPDQNGSRLGPTGCIPSFAPDLVRDGHLKLETFLKGFLPDAVDSAQQNAPSDHFSIEETASCTQLA